MARAVQKSSGSPELCIPNPVTRRHRQARDTPVLRSENAKLETPPRNGVKVSCGTTENAQPVTLPSFHRYHQCLLYIFVLTIITFIFMMRKECCLAILLWNKLSNTLCQVLGLSLHGKQLNNCKSSCYNYWLELIRIFLVLCYAHAKWK